MSKPQISKKSIEVIKQSTLVKITIAISLITITSAFFGGISLPIAILFSIFSLFVAITIALISHYDNKVDDQTSILLEQFKTLHKPMEIFSKLNEIEDGGRTLVQFEKIVDSLFDLKNNDIILNMQLISLELLTKSFLSGNSENQFSIMLSSTPQEVYLSICQFLDLLPRNSNYKTISCFPFWNEETIGNPISFLSKNVDLSESEIIKFERVILVEKVFDDLEEEEKNILHNHSKLTATSTIITKVHVLDKLLDLSKIGNFAYCILPDNKKIILDFKYSYFGGKATFKEVSYRSLDLDLTNNNGLIKHEFKEFEKRFDRYFFDVTTTSLEDYINGTHE